MECLKEIKMCKEEQQAKTDDISYAELNKIRAKSVYMIREIRAMLIHENMDMDEENTPSITHALKSSQSF